MTSLFGYNVDDQNLLEEEWTKRKWWVKERGYGTSFYDFEWHGIHQGVERELNFNFLR